MITEDKITEYIDRHLTTESPLLVELNRTTHLKTTDPGMVSGHAQGNMLQILSRMLKPRRILDIGTFTGYSALCLAEGLAEDGVLYTLETNEEIAELAQSFFDRSPIGSKIKIVLGNAVDSINNLDEELDLVFIDADKENYSKYFHLTVDKLKPGGIILADNVLWKGKVVKEPMDKNTKALHEFNVLVQNDVRVQNVILPIRDGVSLIQKL